MNVELRWLKPHPKSLEDAILQYRQKMSIHIEGTDWRESWSGWITIPGMFDEREYAAWRDKEPVL